MTTQKTLDLMLVKSKDQNLCLEDSWNLKLRDVLLQEIDFNLQGGFTNSFNITSLKK